MFQIINQVQLQLGLFPFLFSILAFVGPHLVEVVDASQQVDRWLDQSQRDEPLTPTPPTATTSTVFSLSEGRPRASKQERLRQRLVDYSLGESNTGHDRNEERPPLLRPAILANVHNDNCPCHDARLCDPIPGPPIRVEGELFGFAAGAHDAFIDQYNWTYVSTIAWAPDALLCQAHAHGTRLIAATPPLDLPSMVGNATARAVWIESTLQMVQGRFFDGVTFDYEEPMDGTDSGHLAETYVTLIHETKQRFAAVHAGYQVSVCVPWSPDGIDGRNYPIAALANASDVLFIMDYDTQAQMYDDSSCLARANAPYQGMKYGLNRYLTLGIAPSKLILGVPWYGYQYTCLPGTTRFTDRYCPIARVPFRGVSCSDAAGRQVPFLSLQALLHSNQTVTTALQRDSVEESPYFNQLEEERNVLYQYWFDDAQSLRFKFVWAKQVGLAGVGPYAFNYVDRHLDPRGLVPTQAIVNLWSAFDEFFVSEQTSHKEF
ncbi:hypothetical protein ACA910_009769 [Epithemia clementina (nom. ined.)]